MPEPTVTTKTWDQLTLCTRADVDLFVRDLEVPLWDADDASADERLEKVFTAVKTEYKERLLDRLPEIFANTAAAASMAGSIIYNGLTFDTWLNQMNYGYDELDSVLDHLGNPEVLTPAFALHSIAAMLDNGAMKLTASQNLMADVIERLAERWTKKANIRFDRAYKQLMIDLNGNGKIDTYERVRSHKSLMRV